MYLGLVYLCFNSCVTLSLYVVILWLLLLIYWLAFNSTYNNNNNNKVILYMECVFILLSLVFNVWIIKWIMKCIFNEIFFVRIFVRVRILHLICHNHVIVCSQINIETIITTTTIINTFIASGPYTQRRCQSRDEIRT